MLANKCLILPTVNTATDFPRIAHGRILTTGKRVFQVENPHLLAMSVRHLLSGRLQNLIEAFYLGTVPLRKVPKAIS